MSLRGLGGSAASRTLVLLDGMPLHSPYTTEIFWARVPRHRIERVELVHLQEGRARVQPVEPDMGASQTRSA